LRVDLWAIKASQCGGERHTEHFTPEREAELLKPFLESASTSGILVVSTYSRPNLSVIGVQIAASAQLAQTRT